MVVPDYKTIVLEVKSYVNQALTMETRNIWIDERGRQHWYELHPHGLVEIIKEPDFVDR